VKVVSEEDKQAEEQMTKQTQELNSMQELMAQMESQLIKGGNALEDVQKEHA